MDQNEILPALLPRLGSAQRKIVTKLFVDRKAGVDELAEMLNLSTSGVRTHLRNLGKLGCVAYEKRCEGPGRPVHIYKLTDEARRIIVRNRLLETADRIRKSLRNGNHHPGPS